MLQADGIAAAPGKTAWQARGMADTYLKLRFLLLLALPWINDTCLRQHFCTADVLLLHTLQLLS